MIKSVTKILIGALVLTAIPTLKTEANELLFSTIMPVGIESLFESNLTVEDYIEAANQAEGASFGYTNLGLCNTEDNNLNIRSIADESGKLIGKLPKQAACEVMYEEGDWSFIVSGKVEGFVKSEYLLTGFSAIQKAQELATLVAVVNTDALKVREEPNTDCEIITQVLRGEVLDVNEVLDNGWINIFLDAEEAFVSSEFVEVKYDLRTAITMTELLYGEGVSNIRVDICQYAKQFIGNRYVWGGTSLTKGADCSGYVQSVFKNFGVRLPRTSVQQASSGTKISVSDMKAGDLIFYARGGRVDHVAIYIGGGQVVHASSPKTGIKISRYNYRTPHTIRRVLYD
ncbi:MAG: NlpC/P60 family protein [Lachnospiraceae bacterium]|nr:NlpC/P60 family protein [Lachnospiraceae bacterium]